MPDESSSAQPVAASAPSPSVPPAPVDPSPGVRITQQIREALTDLGGLALAAYLVSRGAITGQHALLFALALLLPSPLLLRLAKVLGARGTSAGAGVAVALLGASAAWAKMKGVVVLGAGVLGMAACLSGCPLPAPDNCTPFATRCSPSGIPETCSQSQRWSHAPPSSPCSSRGPVVCCRTRSPYGRELHACVPESACLPETAADAGAKVSDAQ
jgi:hypothetical protein